MQFSERERIASRTWRTQLETELQAERFEAEKPLRDAEAKYQQTVKELAVAERTSIITGRDDGFVIDPAVADLTMSRAEANAYNAEAAAAFVSETERYYASELNQSAICSYLERQGVMISSSLCFARAFARLTQFNLLETAPIPEPEPEPVHQEPIVVPVQQAFETGVDRTTGLERTFTPREIENMSSDEYRRTFQLVTVHRSGDWQR